MGVLAALVVLFGASFLGPLRGAVPLLWAWRSRTSWRDLGLSRPASWPRIIVLGIVLGFALKLLMKSVVMPLLGAPAVNAAFQHLQGATSALPAILISVTVGAGFGEELIFRGFLFERLRRRFGDSHGVTVAIVAGTSLVFGAIHLPEQGLAGAQQATLTGLAMGSIYARTRQLWLPIVVHAAFNVTAVFMIYFGQESRVAHWFFR